MSQKLRNHCLAVVLSATALTHASGMVGIGVQRETEDEAREAAARKARADKAQAKVRDRIQRESIAHIAKQAKHDPRHESGAKARRARQAAKIAAKAAHANPST